MDLVRIGKLKIKFMIVILTTLFSCGGQKNIGNRTSPPSSVQNEYKEYSWEHNEDFEVQTVPFIFGIYN